MYVMCNIMHCIAANIREVVIIGLLLQQADKGIRCIAALNLWSSLFLQLLVKIKELNVLQRLS